MGRVESFAAVSLMANVSGLTKGGFAQKMRELIRLHAPCEKTAKELLEGLGVYCKMIPDAWRVLEGHDRVWDPKMGDIPNGHAIPGTTWMSAGVAVLVEAFEIEDTSKLTERRLDNYANLWWILDEIYIGLRLFSVSRYGTIVEQIDLFEWSRQQEVMDDAQD
jgi:hypothetical protein